MANHINSGKIKIRTLRLTLAFSFLLLAIKFFAYFLTHSIAVLSDALESIVNVVAGAFALYSIYFSSQPKDEEHPYGHGKMENLSAGFEGALIFIAGISIIAEAIYASFFPPALKQLDVGVALSGFAGMCNFIMGTYLVKRGKHFNSLTMIADGKHLVSDTISSIGLILGLGLIYFTNLFWIDNLLGVVFGSVILFTGFKLIRESVTNLLDKADIEILNRLITVLNSNRRSKWIDMHNLRILKYGSCLHVDAHLTLPWYNSLEEAHKEMTAVENAVKNNMGNEIEFFIHADPCLPTSCSVCSIENCTERKQPFIKKISWSIENLLPDSKHRI